MDNKKCFPDVGDTVYCVRDGRVVRYRCVERVHAWRTYEDDSGHRVKQNGLDVFVRTPVEAVFRRIYRLICRNGPFIEMADEIRSLLDSAQELFGNTDLRR